MLCSHRSQFCQPICGWIVAKIENKPTSSPVFRPYILSLFMGNFFSTPFHPSRSIDLCRINNTPPDTNFAHISLIFSTTTLDFYGWIIPPFSPFYTPWNKQPPMYSNFTADTDDPYQICRAIALYSHTCVVFTLPLGTFHLLFFL
jgi:hypothetical protein